MHAIRRMVEIALHGIGDQRRFVQDGPVFPEVWIALIEKAGEPAPILIQPYMDLPPPQLARALAERDINRRSNQVVYNNTIVSMNADLVTIVFGLTPLTRWFEKICKEMERHGGERPIAEAARIALDGDLWTDLALYPGEGKTAQSCVRKDFLSFARVAGVVAYFTRGDAEIRKVSAHVEAELAAITSVSPEDGMRHVAELVREGWNSLSRPALMAERYGLPPQPSIYSITNDRTAYLAVADSRKTIKADAATRLFDTSCKGITWAILDSGIDARHPAFLRPLKDGEQADGNVLKRSRVERTYDLSYLREVLLGDDDSQLPAGFTSPADQALIREARTRADNFLPIDWGVLRPLLQMDHASYKAPTNAHGTHVAGILGADWAKGPRGPMQGVCPDIRMIDIRVCKPDGSSDEFVITAALQFLRYLNAHADMMAVHGVNMSISLEHDVANYACGRTPVCLEAERAMSAGIVVVVAAGNRGYRHIKAGDESTFYQYCAVSITDPGNAAAVITVGSTHRREPHNFGVSYFSSRGPTGDGRIKPDLVAPGEKIYAPAPGADALTLDGTSMAAPHVSGAAAMILARNAELIGQPARVKKILCDSATDLGRERYFQGNGLVDVLRALQSI